MKTPAPQPSATRKSAFTLIEMIGVLAIMAILAATITPNALRTLDRAATRAEVDTLHNLGEQAKLYLRDKGTELTVANWNSTTELAKFAWVTPTDLLYNRRQNFPENPADRSRTEVVYANQHNYITRVYVPDPAVANQRAMLISSMRASIALPASLLPTPTPAINAANFATIWNTAEGNVPAGNVLGAAWNANTIEYLVIERINYTPIYATDLRPVPITLNNNSSLNGRYDVVRPDGTYRVRNAPVNAGQPGLPPIVCFPRDRIDLYHIQGAAAVLDYSYVISATSTGRTFDLNNNSKWVPQP